MKKVFFMLLAVMAIAFTGCKVEDATVTVSVENTAGYPVANRYVFYIDKASYIAGAVLPATPTELITGLDESGWEYAETNAQGTVTLKIAMAVAKAKYYFVVFDLGSNQWVEKEIELQRGKNADIEFVVNK
ncbi:MAG: hypothetical protein J5884_04775 [Paludibacteraceae bacterium]|nr:hypothetical protein [Paludibacteraceae bacterium]